MRQLVDQELVIEGMREDSMVKQLDRYIPPAAALGGFILGCLAIAGDIMGVAGTGTGLIIAITIVY